MKNKLLFCTMVAGATAGLSLTASAKKHAEEPLTDAAFAMKAGDAGITEVAAGKLAQANSENEDVKNFGAKMVEDHSKANDALKAIADKDKLTLPDKPGAEHQALLTKLGTEKGAAFDKIYLHAMLAGHKKVAALMDAEAASGKNADLKQFATDTAPVVKSHLSMLEGMQGTGAETEKNHHHAKMSMGTAAESKSGVGPGANGAGDKTDRPGNAAAATNTDSATVPGAGTAAESKSGVGPGSNAAPAASPQ